MAKQSRKGTKRPGATKSTKGTRKPKKKETTEKERDLCFGSYDPEDQNCLKKCDDLKDCIKETEEFEDDLEPEDTEDDEDIEGTGEEDDDDDLDDDDDFDPEELDLDNEDERIATLQDLSLEQLFEVAELYDIDVEDDAEANDLILTIDEAFEESDEEEEEEEEEDDSDDADLEDDDEAEPGLDEESARALLDKVNESIGKAQRRLDKVIEAVEGAQKALTESSEDFEEWLESTYDEELDDDDDLEEEEEEEEEERDEPDFFRPLMEKAGAKITTKGNKTVARKGISYWAALFYTKDDECLLVFNNGNLDKLPGAKKLTKWDSHPYVPADHKNARALLVRHIKSLR